MKFFASLFGKKTETRKADMAAEEAKVVLSPDAMVMADPDAGLGAAAPADAAKKPGAVNIWDLEDDDDDAPAAASPAASRRRRNTTRLIGFDSSQGEVVDLFESAEPRPAIERVQFPVGWLLVVAGEGRGHYFALQPGMSQIGRGEENAVQLDFGDSSISRQNHAAVVFDEEERKFVLGHGGKANIVRLNGKPVISNEDLKDGDQFKIGETTLQLKTLCGDDFDWSDAGDGDDEEREDVAIA